MASMSGRAPSSTLDPTERSAWGDTLSIQHPSLASGATVSRLQLTQAPDFFVEKCRLPRERLDLRV